MPITGKKGWQEQMVHSEVNATQRKTLLPFDADPVRPHEVRLAAAFDAHELSYSSQLDRKHSRVVLETYMASFVLGSDAMSLEKAAMLRNLNEVRL